MVPLYNYITCSCISLLCSLQIKGLVCSACTCPDGYFYSYITEECIPLDSVYQYEPTILEGCDPDRNAEYRTHIEAEIEALLNEYFENSQ
ncbi:hypothetical protein GBAR_LOCUS11630 [Geodia barretti]|uniref:Secreted protein n=1 Tax=Geodia barretti TaxID=519541 RepID=A0AA35RX38_GEOBA|nr:hypothetical protein GBAR_LOCUS11630 [Geodia barretti]